MKKRVVLLVTGRCEKLALGKSLEPLFGDAATFTTVYSDFGFTSNRIPPYIAGETSRAAKLAAAIVAEIDPSESVSTIPHLLVALDDVEVFNVDQPPHLVDYFRAAVEAHVQGHRQWFPSDAASARERLGQRCSFHLLRPMVESYFFGERAALKRAGATRESGFCSEKRDVEDFNIDEAGYLSCAVHPCGADPAFNSRHPKRYLGHISDHFYTETEGGRAALEVLDWRSVLSNPAHATYARSFIEDIADAIGLGSPMPGGQLAEPTRRKTGGLLRNTT